MNKWNYKAGEFQGVVIEEETGRTIAVTYLPEDAQNVAALPELIKALQSLLDDVEYAQPQIKPGLIGNIQIRKAREALEKIGVYSE